MRLVEEDERAVIRGREVKYQIEGGFHSWEWKHQATITDINTGLTGKSNKKTLSKDGALERAVDDLWNKLSVSGHLNPTSSSTTTFTTSTASDSFISIISSTSSISTGLPNPTSSPGILNDHLASHHNPTSDIPIGSSTLVLPFNAHPWSPIATIYVTPVSLLSVITAIGIVIIAYKFISRNGHKKPPAPNPSSDILSKAPQLDNLLYNMTDIGDSFKMYCKLKLNNENVIFESDLVQDFLCLNNEPSRSDPSPNIVPPTSSVLSDTIKIIVQLPDLSVNTFSLSETARTPDLLDVILSDLNVEREWRKYFAIFIQKEGNFIVKLLDSDFPYQIYLQNKDSTPAGGTCLLLRKWLFSVSHEMELLEDEIVCDLLYNEALTNITNGLIDINDEDANLRMLKAQGKKKQYMQLLHKLPSYNTLSFPHCKCDARKTGHIILLLNTMGLSLKACSEEGVLEKQEHSFSWDMISKYEADIEEQTFTFQCLREGKDPRWIRVYSSYRCADRVKEEKNWKKANASTGFMNNDDDDNDDDDDNL